LHDRRAAYDRGAEAERLVAEALVADGWTVRARNHRASGGELDLVVEKGGVVRFVEVKARDPADPSALEAIGEAKQRRITLAADEWLAEHGPFREAAFLVAAVTFRGEGDVSIEWVDDAFDALE
jgi:putative endonuclease